jgi:hypothetical protein
MVTPTTEFGEAGKAGSPWFKSSFLAVEEARSAFPSSVPDFLSSHER